jgi:hypothetical protein
MKDKNERTEDLTKERFNINDYREVILKQLTGFAIDTLDRIGITESDKIVEIIRISPHPSSLHSMVAEVITLTKDPKNFSSRPLKINSPDNKYGPKLYEPFFERESEGDECLLFVLFPDNRLDVYEEQFDNRGSIYLLKSFFLDF